MIPPKPAAEGGWGWKKERKSTLRQHCLTFWAEVCCMSVDIDDYDYDDGDHKRKRERKDLSPGL